MITYQKSLKDRDVILAEVKAIASVIDSVEVTGGSMIVNCSAELVEAEILALADYNCSTMEIIK